MILSVFCILMLLSEDGTGKEKLKKILHYLYMGILGVVLYYGILQVLLRLQGKQLASYQGIDGMAQGNNAGLLTSIKQMYVDFLKFTLRGNVLYQNWISGVALLLLLSQPFLPAGFW